MPAHRTAANLRRSRPMPFALERRDQLPSGQTCPRGSGGSVHLVAPGPGARRSIPPDPPAAARPGPLRPHGPRITRRRCASASYARSAAASAVLGEPCVGAAAAVGQRVTPFLLIKAAITSASAGNSRAGAIAADCGLRILGNGIISGIDIVGCTPLLSSDHRLSAGGRFLVGPRRLHPPRAVYFVTV